MLKAFTLIELLIVVAILGIIAAVSIPYLMKGTMAANEASAISSLRTYFSSQQAYRSTHTPRQYGNIEDIRDEDYMDPSLCNSFINNVVLSGFYFAQSMFSRMGKNIYFDAEAGPEQYDVTGKRQFYLCPTGTIYTRDIHQDGLPGIIGNYFISNPGADWNELAE